VGNEMIPAEAFDLLISGTLSDEKAPANVRATGAAVAAKQKLATEAWSRGDDFVDLAACHNMGHMPFHPFRKAR